VRPYRDIHKTSKFTTRRQESGGRGRWFAPTSLHEAHLRYRRAEAPRRENSAHFYGLGAVAARQMRK
jgi:hypothetical protein